MKSGEKPSQCVMRAGPNAQRIRSLGKGHYDLSICMMILNGLTPEYNEVKNTQHNLYYVDPDVARLIHTLELVHMNIESNIQRVVNDISP